MKWTWYTIQWGTLCLRLRVTRRRRCKVTRSMWTDPNTVWTSHKQLNALWAVDHVLCCWILSLELSVLVTLLSWSHTINNSAWYTTKILLRRISDENHNKYHRYYCQERQWPQFSSIWNESNWFSYYISNTLVDLLVSVGHLRILPERFGKKDLWITNLISVYRKKDVMPSRSVVVTSWRQTPVVSMTTRLIYNLYQWKRHMNEKIE